MSIITIDLQFTGHASAIAAYLITHAKGAMLIECGPSSTLTAVQAALGEHGLQPADVTDVFVTHIHLDHAGSAGWWARHGAGGEGANIHVHPKGAPHLLNPEKLLASATRIYGDQMDELWGDFLPVGAEKLLTHVDGDSVTTGDLRVDVLDMPGHALHHFVFLCNGTAFMGDVGGVRLPETPQYLSLPTPPPEFHLEMWRTSVQRLQQLQSSGKFDSIALTHFGQFSDAAWHLDTLARRLDVLETWMKSTLPNLDLLDDDQRRQEIRRHLAGWEKAQAIADGLTNEQIESSLIANPSDMSADGIARYWKKYCRE